MMPYDIPVKKNVAKVCLKGEIPDWVRISSSEEELEILEALSAKYEMKYYTMDDGLKGTLPNIMKDGDLISLLLSNNSESPMDDYQIDNVEKCQLNVNSRYVGIRYQSEYIDRVAVAGGNYLLWLKFMYNYNTDQKKIDGNLTTNVYLEPREVPTSVVWFDGIYGAIPVNGGTKIEYAISGSLKTKLEITTRGIVTEIILLKIDIGPFQVSVIPSGN